MPKFHKFSSTCWAKHSAVLIQAVISHTVKKSGRCSVMLTGGRSAARLYTEWAKIPALRHTQGLTFFLGDERCVPLYDPESNGGMAMRILFSNDLPEGIDFYSINTLDFEREAAVKRYDQLLPDSIDVMLLGVGEDGHVASVFPNSSAFAANDRRAVLVLTPDGLSNRVTVTPRVISSAKNIFVLAPGDKKLKVLTAAMDNPSNVRAMPVRLVLDANWLIEVDK
jgi:6-phosphogluconolactonase